MINREMRKAKLLAFDDSVDGYGRINQGVPQEKDIELTLRIYQHSNVEDVRFNDVTHMALTANKEVTDANKVTIDGITYSIVFVNPEGRLTQLLLKKDG